MAYFIALAQLSDCNIKINERRMKSACDLSNGVLIEKITVYELDSSGIPSDYRVTERYHLYNPGVSGKQEYWPRKIFFRKKNGHYMWGADTVNLHFRRKGRIIRLIEGDSLSAQPYYRFTHGTRDIPVAPFQFEKDTWYYLDIFYQGLAAIYVYVDQRKKFHVHTISNGLSPI